MKIRQARKIIKQGTFIGNHNDYWIDRWFDFIGVRRYVGRETDGDHRIRKAIVVYERGKKNVLRKELKKSKT